MSNEIAFGEAGQRARQRRPDHAARRAGDEDPRRVRGGLLERRDATGRTHHQGLGQARFGARGRRAPQVARDDGPEVGVGGRRRRALVLAELGRHLV